MQDVDDYEAITADPTVELECNLTDLLKNTARRKSIAQRKNRLSLMPGRITIGTVCKLAKIDLDKSGRDTFESRCQFFRAVVAIDDICKGNREFTGALARETATTLEEAIGEAAQGGASEDWEDECVIELSR